MNEELTIYERNMRKHDDHEADLQRWRTWLSVAVVGLFSLLCGSVYANVYLLQPPVAVHHIDVPDEQGRVSSRVIPRADQIPATDPGKEFITQRFVKDWVTNFKSRPLDSGFLKVSYNTAKQQTAGSAFGKFMAAYKAENPWTRIEKEGVQVLERGQPHRLTPSKWQIEWYEKVTNKDGNDQRMELWQGIITLAESPTNVASNNPFGFVVTDIEMGEIKTPKEGL